MLKNEKGTLPLPRSAQRIAVIGPNALLSQSDAGYYGPSDVCGGNFWTLVDAVNASGGDGVQVRGRCRPAELPTLLAAPTLPTAAQQVWTTPGVPSVLSNDTSGIAAAVDMAKRADRVVLAIGTDLSWGREGKDATSLSLTPAQAELVQKV